MYHSGTLYSESTFDIDNGIIQQQLCAMKKSTVEGHRRALRIARNLEWILGLMFFRATQLLDLSKLKVILSK